MADDINQLSIMRKIHLIYYIKPRIENINKNPNQAEYNDNCILEKGILTASNCLKTFTQSKRRGLLKQEHFHEYH